MHKSHSLTISNGSFFQHLSSDESFSLSTGWLSWMSSSKPLLLFRGSSMWDKWRDSRMMIRIESLRKKKAKWLKTFSPFLGVTFPTSRLAQIFVCNNKNELCSNMYLCGISFTNIYNKLLHFTSNSMKTWQLYIKNISANKMDRRVRRHQSCHIWCSRMGPKASFI